LVHLDFGRQWRRGCYRHCGLAEAADTGSDCCLLGCYGRTRSRAGGGESSRRRMTSAKSRHCQTDDVTTEDAAMLIPNHTVRIFVYVYRLMLELHSFNLLYLL